MNFNIDDNDKEFKFRKHSFSITFEICMRLPLVFLRSSAEIEMRIILSQCYMFRTAVWFMTKFLWAQIKRLLFCSFVFHCKIRMERIKGTLENCSFFFAHTCQMDRFEINADHRLADKWNETKKNEKRTNGKPRKRNENGDCNEAITPVSLFGPIATAVHKLYDITFLFLSPDIFQFVDASQ